MNTIQSISEVSLESEDLIIGSTVPTGYPREEIGIEKQISINWLKNLYEDSLAHDMLLVLTSPTQ